MHCNTKRRGSPNHFSFRCSYIYFMSVKFNSYTDKSLVLCYSFNLSLAWEKPHISFTYITLRLTRLLTYLKWEEYIILIFMQLSHFCWMFVGFKCLNQSLDPQPPSKVKRSQPNPPREHKWWWLITEYSKKHTHTHRWWLFTYKFYINSSKLLIMIRRHRRESSSLTFFRCGTMVSA